MIRIYCIAVVMLFLGIWIGENLAVVKSYVACYGNEVRDVR